MSHSAILLILFSFLTANSILSQVQGSVSYFEMIGIDGIYPKIDTKRCCGVHFPRSRAHIYAKWDPSWESATDYEALNLLHHDRKVLSRHYGEWGARGAFKLLLLLPMTLLPLRDVAGFGDLDDE